ncbi:aldehyde dehydrogenase family protein [Mycobacterium xenopi 4042]|uniref:Aldehyde dehydrogenase family protein n=1 Tax=Mycobacterium xenopi 4042 TaxID=1299334 RepID=X7YKZ3_MYCXE|nr:aldehyde dehydrogenase family protein [Mycobacterium xenopi 4042]
MRFIELVNQHTDELAEMLSLEHGKTLADSRGDIQRGIEVIEFCIGIPHLLKGEYSEGAGPGIDVYSLRQPLGVVAGITPFNFPAMIPLWKAGRRWRVEMRSFSSLPSATRRSRCGWPSCSSKRACRPGCSRSCTATRKPSTPSWPIPTSRPSALSAVPISRPTSTRPRPRTGSARNASRRQEPHDRDARRRPRPGSGRADRRRIWQRRRTLHGRQRCRAGRRADRRTVARQAG